MLSWSLTGFAVRFIGERAIIHFREDHALDVTAYLKVELDGIERKYGIIDGREKIVLDGLGDGEHTLVLRRVSAGDVSYTPMGEGHGIKNVGKENLEFIALILNV